MPVNEANIVPLGIDFLGFFKSPDNPRPAVIPVNAGNIMAKTAKILTNLYFEMNSQYPNFLCFQLVVQEK